MDRGAGRAPDLIPPDLVTARGDYRRLAVAPTRSRAPIRHLGRARIPSARSDPPGSVDDRDAGASPIRAASGYGTQAAVRAFNGLPDDLDAPAIADQSVPRSAADPRSERRSDDGQTILGAMTMVDSKPTTCTFGRDGGIRTRGLLLPNQLHLDAGCGSVSLNIGLT